MPFFTFNEVVNILGVPAPSLLSAIESKEISAWKKSDGKHDYHLDAANLAKLFGTPLDDMIKQLEWKHNKIVKQYSNSTVSPAADATAARPPINSSREQTLLPAPVSDIENNVESPDIGKLENAQKGPTDTQNREPLIDNELQKESDINPPLLENTQSHVDEAEDVEPLAIIQNNVDKYKGDVKFRTSQRKAFDDYAENNIKGIPDYVTAYNLKITTSNGRNLTLDTRKNSLHMLKKLFPSGRKSLGTKCENEAINIANKLIYEGLLEHGYPPIEKTKESNLWHHCFKDTYLKNKVAKNKTMSDMQSKLSFWFYVLSPISPEQIDTSMILSICDYLMDKHGIKGSTISGYFTELRKVLTYAHERGLIKSELNIPYMKSDQRGFIMVDQLTMALFIKYYARYNGEKRLLWLLWLTGLRLDMIISLTVEQINFKERVITYAPDKNKSQKFISIPISRLTARLLESQWKSIGSPISGYIFPGLNIDYKRVRKAAEQAGLGKEFVPHHLRHNAVRMYLDAGISIEDIKVICGWTCTESMNRYKHNQIQQTAKDGVEKVRSKRTTNEAVSLDNSISHITVTGNNNSIEVNQSNALQKA
ncbi:tyrosine-type recombinase/integrase [Thalassotalea maritima]|uniref:tyrosine-type recombinase/integrase n=1 Tax=Thalassotalea maritima TaxID=3242416 RepID=UPI003529B162